MNCLPTVAVLGLLAAVPLRAQRAVGFEQSLAVRVPAICDADLGALLPELLATSSVQVALREAFVRSLPDGSLIECQTPSCPVTVVAAHTLALVRLGFSATTALPMGPSPGPASAEAVAAVLRERLETLLHTPIALELDAALQGGEVSLQKASVELEQAESRLAELGADDEPSAAAALADLRRQAIELDLDQRTEQIVADQLQQQLLAQEKRRTDAAAALQSLATTVDMHENQLATSSRPDEATPLRLLLQGLRPQVQAAQAAFDRAARDSATLQDQVTANAIALRRHAARRATLDALQKEQQDRAANARDRARERAQLRRAIAAAETTVQQAHQDLATARQRRLALRPIAVQPWH